jgi:magnesium transporter
VLPVIKAYLYDAEGEDREVPLGEGVPALSDQHLLWIDVEGRDEHDLDELQRLLGLDRRAMANLRQNRRSLALNNYGEYFQFDVLCLGITSLADLHIPRVPAALKLDFVVGKQWLLTVHDEEVFFFTDFRAQERGETLIGNLSPSSLAAALLDWHLTVFLEVMTRFQSFVDALDVRMLAKKAIRDDLLGLVVAGRRYVSSLRRVLAPQRSIFYGLSRPDFVLVATSSAAEHFQSLERRFERTLDSIDHGRELMQGSFELFNTRVAESTNVLIRRLTLASVMLGVIGAAAGIFGMNFETPYTQTGLVGFWIVVACLVSFIIGSVVLSRWRGWI